MFLPYHFELFEGVFCFYNTEITEIHIMKKAEPVTCLFLRLLYIKNLLQRPRICKCANHKRTNKSLGYLAKCNLG